MLAEVVRPTSVPEEAKWQEDSQRWELVNRDAAGVPQGPVTLWRPDGSLEFQSSYSGGVLHGAFRRYHHSGALSRIGQFVHGEIDGVVMAHAAAEEASTPLRGCCVPAGAARMEARYDAGALRGETFFDSEGHVLLSDGRRRPPPPPDLPPGIHFEESSDRWYTGAYDASSGKSYGTWTWWRQDGSVSEEVDFHEGHRTAVRNFDAHGQLLESVDLLVHEGYDVIRHGAWKRRLTTQEAVAWGVSLDASETVCDKVTPPMWLLGQFDGGQSVGRWSLQRGESHLWQRDLGLPFAPEHEATSHVLTGATADADTWLGLAQTLAATRQPREALVAACRAVGAGAPLDTFWLAFERMTLPRSKEMAEQEAQALADVESRSVSKLLEALVTGAEPAEVLRLLATSVPVWRDIARDLVTTSVKLAPLRAEGYLTHALVCLETGDDDGLRENVEHLVVASEEAAAYFVEAAKVLRPSYPFIPGLIKLPPLPEPVPLQPMQPLPHVQHVARVYASRLLAVRHALTRFSAGEASWAPPALTAWLPDGPLALVTESAEIEDEDEHGQVERTTVQVDESLALDDIGVSGLICRARADWTGLCWLLWACGYSAVDFPTAIRPCPEYPQALTLAVERAWRARDQISTSGLRSMTQGLASFEWEGQDIADLPRNLLNVCVEEYVEMRAVLLWLSNPGNLSPFQDDLRRA